MLGIWLSAAPALTDTPQQPPMNSFDFAFYTCDGGAFEIDYDSDTPTHATIVTGAKNRHYELTRTPSQNGVQFQDKGVRFWTDGKKVLVEGIAPGLEHCRLKTG